MSQSDPLLTFLDKVAVVEIAEQHYLDIPDHACSTGECLHSTQVKCDAQLLHDYPNQTIARLVAICRAQDEALAHIASAEFDGCARADAKINVAREGRARARGLTTGEGGKLS